MTAKRQTKIKAPFGSWRSSVSPKVLSGKGNRLGHLCVDGAVTYWLESRASEQGRGVLLCTSKSGQPTEVLPKSCSVRSKVHEYGGADFYVDKGVVWFSDASDQKIYQYSVANKKLTVVTKITATEDHRYADFCVTEDHQFLIAVRERHLSTEVINDLVIIDIESGDIRQLASGFDFYASPKLSPGGRRLAWICWNQPDMPWDATELWVADLHKDGHLDGAHRVTGGRDVRPGGVSVVQPDWSPGGVLHFISDASGYYNLYSFRNGELNALTPQAYDFAPPQWQLGYRSYANFANGKIIACCYQSGSQQLVEIDSEQGMIRKVEQPFTSFSGAFDASEDAVSFIASAPGSAQTVCRYWVTKQTQDSPTGGQLEKLTDDAIKGVDQENLSCARSIWVEVTDQHQPSPRDVHAFFYEPVNSQYAGTENERPPLIVLSHGGPTGNADNGFDLNIQFWTNRGFAVVDVNYSGSSGFGRAYRDRLKNNWGILDTADCIAVANHLAEQGLVDGKRMLIRGGSAGGYTTLCALTFYDVFAAGMSRYGVADLKALAADSHKFEARYLDSLVGQLPQDEAIYEARSPIHHTEQLSCPILILQGADDKVVPPNQAEMMVEALETKKIPFAYLLFEGEGHGFRKAENIEAAFAAELSFYRQILGIDADEEISHLDINYKS